MKFTGEDSDINIKTEKPEFLEWKWIDLDMITEVVVDFKLHVYKELEEKIKKIIKKHKKNIFLDKAKYNFKYFTELYENNLSSFGIYLKTATSITNDDVKLSERVFIPSSRLRGFERGKIGPKDGDDFIGGNYLSSINFTSTIPQILENITDQMC